MATKIIIDTIFGWIVMKSKSCSFIVYGSSYRYWLLLVHNVQNCEADYRAEICGACSLSFLM